MGGPVSACHCCTATESRPSNLATRGHGVAMVADQESPEVSNWSNLQLGLGLALR